VLCLGSGINAAGMQTAALRHLAALLRQIVQLALRAPSPASVSGDQQLLLLARDQYRSWASLGFIRAVATHRYRVNFPPKIVNCVLYVYLHNKLSNTITPTLTRKDCYVIALETLFARRKKTVSEIFFPICFMKTVALLMCLKGSLL
jgi:hypothetical protein